MFKKIGENKLEERLVLWNLLDSLILSKEQGFAFYYEENGMTVEKYQGKQRRNGKVIDADTNFRIASITKQFVAHAILLLIRDGKIDLNTKLSSLFTDLPEYMNRITIYNLIFHTSGISDFEDMEHDETQVTDKEVFEYLKTLKMGYFEPDTRYQYSNSGYIVLGKIIEKVTNTTVAEFVKNKIFKSNKMDRSDFNTNGLENICDRAYGYKKEGEEILEVDQNWMSATCADGGVYSNVNDLKKWLNYLSEDELIQQGVVDTDCEMVGVNEEKYGYGVNVIKCERIGGDGETIIYHCGETTGTTTVIGFVPEMKIKFIFLSNIELAAIEQLVENLVNSILFQG